MTEGSEQLFGVYAETVEFDKPLWMSGLSFALVIDDIVTDQPSALQDRAGKC